jgi:hypothetical protein
VLLDFVVSLLQLVLQQAYLLPQPIELGLLLPLLPDISLQVVLLPTAGIPLQPHHLVLQQHQLARLQL